MSTTNQRALTYIVIRGPRRCNAGRTESSSRRSRSGDRGSRSRAAASSIGGIPDPPDIDPVPATTRFRGIAGRRVIALTRREQRAVEAVGAAAIAPELDTEVEVRGAAGGSGVAEVVARLVRVVGVVAGAFGGEEADVGRHGFVGSAVAGDVVCLGLEVDDETGLQVMLADCQWQWVRLQSVVLVCSVLCKGKSDEKKDVLEVSG